MAQEGRDEKGNFIKGNLFSIGNNGGQPPKYNDPAIMEKKIAEYLDWEDQWKNKGAKGEGKGVYTLEGCALYLGFASVQSMYDYEKRTSEFSYVLNRYRLFMAHWNVQKIYWGGTTAGAQYWLNNKSDYSNEQTINNNNVITEVKVEVNKNSPPLEDKE